MLVMCCSFSFCQHLLFSPGYLRATNQCQMFIHMYPVRNLGDWKKSFISHTLHWKTPVCYGNTQTGNCMDPKGRPENSLWCREQHGSICCGLSLLKWSFNELKISTCLDSKHACKIGGTEFPLWRVMLAKWMATAWHPHTSLF